MGPQPSAEGEESQELALAKKVALAPRIERVNLAAERQETGADRGGLRQAARLHRTDRAVEKSRRDLSGGLDFVVAELPNVRDARLELRILDVQLGDRDDVVGDHGIEPGDRAGIELDSAGRLRLVDQRGRLRRYQGEGRRLPGGGLRGGLGGLTECLSRGIRRRDDSGRPGTRTGRFVDVE